MFVVTYLQIIAIDKMKHIDLAVDKKDITESTFNIRAGEIIIR